MQVINFIKNNFARAAVTRCFERGCELKFNGLDKYVVLKGERVCRDRKMCDCIIFKARGYIIIGIAELKSKTAHSSEIVEKLTNGSEIALDILKEGVIKYKRSLMYQFCHLVLCKKWHTSEYKVISREKITVKGKRYDIILKRCGVSFSEIISGLK